MNKNIELFSDEEMIKIKEKIVNGMSCAICGKSKFTIVGRTVLLRQEDFDSYVIGGGSWIPAVMLHCTDCGNLTFHAAHTIGLINKETDTNG